jgi:hypothetical protein
MRRRRFGIGELRSAVVTLRVHWGANVLIGACFVAISTFTAAQAPAQASQSPQQANANEAKAGKKSESAACVAKSDDLASPNRESAQREAGENSERISSEENGEATSGTNLTLRAPSTTDSTSEKVQGGEPAADVHQESHSEVPAHSNAVSPQQCTASKGSRETEHVRLR